jgi:hypothetical protein
MHQRQVRKIQYLAEKNEPNLMAWHTTRGRGDCLGVSLTLGGPARRSPLATAGRDKGGPALRSFSEGGCPSVAQIGRLRKGPPRGEG